MSNPVFRSLRIDAFRGFNKPATFDLCASAVLLRGPNGTGKTSVFDALQWLLLGDIERLRALRERRDAEHLVNRYRVPGPAIVEAELSVDGGVARVRRSGNYSGSQLSYHHDDETLEGDDAMQALTAALLPQRAGDIAAVLLTSGMLQQDVMRSLLEAKPGERFAALSRLLRLEELESFQSAVERASDRASQRTAEVRNEAHNARQRREALEQQLAAVREEALTDTTIDSAAAALDSALEATQGRIALSAGRPDTPQAAALLSREAAAMRRRIAELGLELADLSGRSEEETATEERAPLEQTIAESREALDGLEERAARLDDRIRDVEQTSEEFTRLASLAIPFLGETCPICRQSITPETVEAHLRERIGDTSQLVELREEREQVRGATRQAAERLEVAERRLRQLQQAEQERLRAAERRKSLLDDLDRAREGRMLRVALEVTDPSGLDVIESDLRNLDRIAGDLAAALGSSAAGARIASVERELDVARENETERTQALERVARAETDSSTLVKATKAARVEVAEQRYARVRPLVQDLFSRLDAHRAFTELDLEPTVYGRAGTTVMTTTRDPERDISASPALVYSSAQANVAALAYFVALSWGARDHSLPFLMLDDPLQSMDDVNVLAFADLCRFLRGQRQVFVSTHERRFADLLERKLAPRQDGHRTVVLDFTGWDREGPEVHERVLPRARADVGDLFLRQRRGGAPAPL